MKRVVILGAAGVGRRCADISNQMGWELVGVLDDSISPIDKLKLEVRRIPFLGSSGEFFSKYPNIPTVLGIGVPEPRLRVHEKLLALGVKEFPTIIDESSNIGSEVTLGEGIVVCSGAQISTHSVLEDFVHINPGVIIGHDVRIERNVSINPGAIISGDVTIGESSMIGAGAVVLQGLKIGPGAVVGAGSVVTRNVGAGVVVKGNPAK